jgi:hypothetical protein
MMGRRWTDKDVLELKQLLAQHHRLQKIAELIDRPVGGVVFKVHQLKVSERAYNSAIGAATAADPGAAGFDWPK